MQRRPWIAVAAALTLLIAALASVAPVAAAGGGVGEVRTIHRGDTSTPDTGNFKPSGTERDAFTGEFSAQDEDGDGEPDTYDGLIVNRSESHGHGDGASVNSGKKAKSNPTVDTTFDGLNHYQQRYARGGNQFSIEPPDQALCVGNGFVLEAVNDVLNVYDTSGQSQLPNNTATNIVAGFPRNVDHSVDLNSFYGYPAAINRTTGAFGPELTDPTCIYDAATQRFFLVVLTLDRVGTSQTLSLVNHLDLAVSDTSDPTGLWNIYKINVTNDGTNTGGQNPGPYIGDYPHIGADANGVYLTTNAYPWTANGFSGAQIYALSKAELAAGAAAVTMVHIDTSGMVNAPSDAGPTQPGFTVWPAQSPGSQFQDANGGTEYFLSSNAATEATRPVSGTGGPNASSKVVVWTLGNTSSLDSASPSLSLATKLVGVGTYAVPPRVHQPGSGDPPGTSVPQGHCINDTTTSTAAGTGCWRLLFNPPAPAHDEVISRPDSNDSRMQQVMYANGKLWGALDTALNPDGGPQRAGIAWYVLNPSNGKVVKDGYLGAAGMDFTYPAVGVTGSGRGVMAFTAVGDAVNPSAAYSAIDAIAGVGAWNYVTGGQGAAPDDGFTSYKAQVGNPPRTRWGDYGAASVVGNSVWIASEYIASPCNYTDWGGPFFTGGTGDNLLGTCGGASHGPGSRTALANWATRISKLTP